MGDGEGRDTQRSRTPLTLADFKNLSSDLWQCQLGNFASKVDIGQRLPSAGPWDPCLHPQRPSKAPKLARAWQVTQLLYR